MRFVAAVLLVVGLTGCKSVTEGAREDFSRSHTCPLDRVEARERSDVRPSSLEDDTKPPADIAADPGRLKMWQDERAKNREVLDSRYTTVEVRGCGKLEIQTCNRGSRNANTVFCRKREYPAGVAKWQ